MRLGYVYAIPPEPLEPDRTRFVEAGAIRIGVEFRNIDNASLRAAFAADAELAAGLEAVLGEAQVADRGVSLHVCGTQDGHEYLRFDCFETDPHYHYNHRVDAGAQPVNHVVFFDPTAGGDMLDWAIGALRARLPAMLAEANGAALAAGLDPAALGFALDEVERLARAARS